MSTSASLGLSTLNLHHYSRQTFACLELRRHTHKEGVKCKRAAVKKRRLNPRYREGSSLTTNEIILACVVGIPVVFALGRFSNRITWFHAKNEERYSVPEFIRGRQ